MNANKELPYYSITLPRDAIEVLGDLLGRAPYVVAAPIVGMIRQQMDQQEAASAALEKEHGAD